MLVADFFQNLFNLLLGLFAIRFVQTRLDPNSDFGKALAYIVH